jgi:hypothetical protein
MLAIVLDKPSSAKGAPRAETKTMSRTIQNQTEAESIAAVEAVIEDAYQSLEDQGVPYAATIADAMRVVGLAEVRKKFGNE